MGSHLIAQPEPSEWLLEASPAVEEPSQPIDGRVVALWQDVRRELIAAASIGGKLWLPHVRLVALEDDRAVLSSPPIGAQRQLEARYQEEIAGKLGDVLGCDIAVGWQAGWLAQPSSTPGGPTPTACAMPFVDLSGNVFVTAIQYLYCGGVVNRVDSTHYGPAGTSTRGQFAKVVTLGFAIASYTPSGPPDFSDVPPSYFAYLYIESGLSRRHPEADTLIEQAIAIHQSLHDIAGQIKAVTNLTYSYNVQRRFAESCQVADWGVALARQIGNRHAELNLLGNLAAAEAALGEAAALEHKGMVVALKRELGVPASELQLELTQLAHMHLKLGNLDTAQRQIQEALGLDLPEQSVIIFWHFTHWTAALVMRAAGDIATSRTHLEQAYALYQQELVTITDPAARAHHMAQSTDLLAAVERGEWPAYAAPPPGSTLESEQHSPCPRCHKIAGVVKAGQASSGGQRYRCQSCQRYFTVQAKARGYPAELRQQATALHHAGQGVRAIARQLSINPQTVSNWLAAEPKPRL